MIVYGLTLAILLILLALYHGKGSPNHKSIILGLCCIILVCVSGFRYKVGTDYVNYMNAYDFYLSRSLTSFLSQPGLTVVAKIASKIYNDYATWFFLMAIIAVVPVFVGIKKHSIMPDLSVLLFVLLGCWSFSLNIVKQTAASAILVLGYKALKDHSFVCWVIICLIAATFHFSALLMIPAFFLVSIPFSKRTALILFAMGFAVLLFYDHLFNIASYLKQGKDLVSLASNTRNGSVNILRVFVNCAPILLYFIYHNNCDIKNKDLSSMLNMSMLNVALNFGTMKSIYLYRICVYTNVFNIFLIPLIIRRIRPKQKYLVVSIMLVLYAIFWWYDLKKGTSTSSFQWIFER